MRRLVLLLGAVAVAVLGGSPVGAGQPPVQPIDSCFGVDHFPEDPVFADAPSEGHPGLTVPREFAGRDLLIVTDHLRPDGTPSAGFDTIDDDGRAVAPIPLYSYARVRATTIAIAPDGLSLAGTDLATLDTTGFTEVNPAGIEITVDSSEPVCDRSTLTAAPPAAVETTSSSTTSTTASTSTSTTTSSSTPTSSRTSRPGWPLVTGLLGVLAVTTGVIISRTGIRASVPTTPSPIGSTPDDEPTGLRPVIFVPGIMATALTTRGRDGLDHQVWPPLGFGGDIGKCMEALLATEPARLQVDTVGNTGLLPGIHRRILTFLDSWGYHLSGPKPNLYVHAYNWMLPCSDAGKALAALIDRANAEHGRPPTVICHSMGGLVTRAAYHLHGGTAVDKVIYIASPHHGAPMAYYSLHPAIPYQFLPGVGGSILNAGYATAVASERRSADRLAAATASGSLVPGIDAAIQGAMENAVGFLAEAALGSSLFDDTMKLIAQNAAGVLELMPDEDYFATIHPQYPVVRDRADGSTPTTWQECYLGPGPWALPPHLQQKVRDAMAFKASISKQLPPEDGSRCVVVYGGRHPTSTEAVVEQTPDGIAGEITEDHQHGDATVPRQSGRGQILWPPGTTVELDNGAEHFMLTETDTVQSILEQHLPRGDAP